MIKIIVVVLPDADALKGSVKSIPTREVIDVPVNEMLIVELYSK